jgi:hypothetical protein
MNESLLSNIKSVSLSYSEYYNLAKKEVETANADKLLDDEKNALKIKGLSLLNNKNREIL